MGCWGGGGCRFISDGYRSIVGGGADDENPLQAKQVLNPHNFNSAAFAEARRKVKFSDIY